MKEKKKIFVNNRGRSLRILGASGKAQCPARGEKNIYIY